jgi:transcriptional regulator with XRE-family HTH domain
MGDLGARLTQLIKQRRLTTHAVAVAAGVDPSYLYRLLASERRRPSNETLDRLAAVLGVSVDELTGRAEPGVLTAAATQRLARIAAALADIDLEAHLQALARLSASGRADCVAYVQWRVQREEAEGPPRPRDFHMETPEPAGVRVLGESPPAAPERRHAS